MSLLYHAYVYLEFLILACTIYILAPHSVTELIETTELLDAYVAEFMRWEDLRHWKKQKNRGERK